jgi:glycopeptide antibiotics resistance protein
VLFAAYLVLLVWVVLWKLEAPWAGGDRNIKLVPFVRTRGAGASAPVEVAANLALFIPFGLYVGLLQPARRPASAIVPVAVGAAGTSLALEVGQYVLAVGRSDTTDIVVNTVGALVGLGLYALARQRLGAGTVSALTRTCAVGTAFALLCAGLYLGSSSRIVHVRDVGPLSQVDGPGDRRPAAVPPGMPGG